MESGARTELNLQIPFYRKVGIAKFFSTSFPSSRKVEMWCQRIHFPCSRPWLSEMFCVSSRWGCRAPSVLRFIQLISKKVCLVLMMWVRVLELPKGLQIPAGHLEFHLNPVLSPALLPVLSRCQFSLLLLWRMTGTEVETWKKVKFISSLHLSAPFFYQEFVFLVSGALWRSWGSSTTESWETPTLLTAPKSCFSTATEGMEGLVSFPSLLLKPHLSLTFLIHCQDSWCSLSNPGSISLFMTHEQPGDVERGKREVKFVCWVLLPWHTSKSTSVSGDSPALRVNLQLWFYQCPAGEDLSFLLALKSHRQLELQMTGK